MHSWPHFQYAVAPSICGLRNAAPQEGNSYIYNRTPHSIWLIKINKYLAPSRCISAWAAASHSEFANSSSKFTHSITIIMLRPAPFFGSRAQHISTNMLGLREIHGVYDGWWCCARCLSITLRKIPASRANTGTSTTKLGIHRAYIA